MHLIPEVVERDTCQRACEHRFVDLVHPVAAGLETGQVGQVVVRRRDALEVIRRGGLKAKHRKQISASVVGRSDIRELPHLIGPKGPRLCDEAFQGVVEPKEAVGGVNARWRTRDDEPVGLVADADRGQRSPPGHPPDIERAQRIQRGIVGDLSDHGA